MSVKIYAIWTSIIGMFATQMAKGFVISKKKQNVIGSGFVVYLLVIKIGITYILEYDH